MFCVNTCFYTVPENQNPNAHFIDCMMKFKAVNKKMTNELVESTTSQADEEKNPLSPPKIKQWSSRLPGDTSSKFAGK
jgi:hypothetical protein